VVVPSSDEVKLIRHSLCARFDGPSRQAFDLRRLPSWLQYAISLPVVGVISTVAWLTGRDKPVPKWVSDIVVPNLLWVFIGLLAIAAVGTLLERWSRKNGEE
jgi:hypothetical protein